MMKQILLITDGCSNVGMEPAVAAAFAAEEGITVNVIGIVDHGEFGAYGIEEVEEIARAGRGMSRIVSSEQLTQTVQMMTRQTVVQTIQQAVSLELKQILGNGEIDELAPMKREQVVQVIDDLSETTSLRVALLVDASASMKPKLQTVQASIEDLLLSLQARAGQSEISVFHFPGSRMSAHDVEMDVDWTNQLDKLHRLFYKLNMRGATPTGPALLQVVQFYKQGVLRPSPWQEVSNRQPLEKGSMRSNHGSGDGILGDYIV